MGLLTAALGAYGIYVLTAAGNFVVDLYDRPLMATNFERAAAVDFAQMDKELARRDRADEPGRAAIDARISRLSRVFSEDLAVAESRSLSDEERLAIDQIELLVAKWNELRLGNAQTASADELDRLAADIAHRFELLAEATTGQSFVARRKVVSAVTFFKYSSLAALVGALLLSGGLTLLLMRRIIRPLREAAAIADRIAEGELQAPIPPGGPDETGVLLRSMTVMQDSIRIMVEREKAQRRSAQTRLVDALESSHEAIVLMDAAGRIVIGNSQLARFFPTIASRLAPAMSFTDAFRSLEFSVGGAGAAAAFDPTEPAVGGLASRGREFWLADGRWLRVSRSATHDGGFFLLISDISDLKEREQRLDEARRLAEAASEAKSSFLAAMSHELRTPLNAVIGFSELLSRQMFGALGNPKYVEYADSIQHSGRHLLGVINTVLDLSKHQAGKLQLMIEPLDLAEIVGRCAAMMRDQCARAGLELRIRSADGLTMEGDAGKLQQMLLNLLSNAAKFTEAGSIAVTAELSGHDRVMLRVTDTGIGMLPEEIPVALAIFGQIDTRLARRYEGTGLGLPLVNSIVELHGGELQIDSAPGQGTAVTIFLPRQAALAPAEVERPRQLERVA